jgi:hypothetical protein
MLVNEYRLEIQFKEVRNVQNVNNIPMVGTRPLECRPAQNGLYMVFNYLLYYECTICMHACVLQS